MDARRDDDVVVVNKKKNKKNKKTRCERFRCNYDIRFPRAPRQGTIKEVVIISLDGGIDRSAVKVRQTQKDELATIDKRPIWIIIK